MPDTPLTAVGPTIKSRLFRGLADPSRLGILEALRDGSRSVGDLVKVTGLTQPGVSNHLACLLDCGLVSREQRGKFVFYSVSEARVEALLALADELLGDTASGAACCRRYAAEPGA